MRVKNWQALRAEGESASPDDLTHYMEAVSRLKAERDELRARVDALTEALRETKVELTNENVSYQHGKALPPDPLTDIDNAIAVIDDALAAVGVPPEQTPK